MGHRIRNNLSEILCKICYKFPISSQVNLSVKTELNPLKVLYFTKINYPIETCHLSSIMYISIKAWIPSINVNKFVVVYDWYMNHWKKFALTYIWSSLLVAQILLIFVFGMDNESGVQIT